MLRIEENYEKKPKKGNRPGNRYRISVGRNRQKEKTGTQGSRNRDLVLFLRSDRLLKEINILDKSSMG